MIKSNKTFYHLEMETLHHHCTKVQKKKKITHEVFSSLPDTPSESFENQMTKANSFHHKTKFNTLDFLVKILRK